MRKSGRIFGKFSRGVGCDPTRVVAYLNSIYPNKMPEAVEADTGIAAGTVRKWPDSAPSFRAFVRLLEVYGPELLAACMTSPEPWVSEAARQARRARVTAMRDALSRQLEREDA